MNIKKEITKPHRILGIDPGFGRMGFGVIEERKGNWVCLDYGCIETSADSSFVERLVIIHEELKKIIDKYQIQRAAVEDLFFAKNAKTAIKVGQARGAILLTLHQAGIPIDEFTPLQVKQSVVGYGKAEKMQIQKMVMMILGIKAKKIQDDAADALAIALTCASNIKLGDILKRK